MNIKNPEYFLTVAREGSVSKAAERLYLSQPYLSQCIGRLEKDLGAKLFDRSHSPLTLTEAGKLYQTYLEGVGNLAGRFASQLDEIKSGRSRILNVGMSLWRGSVVLPEILPAYMASHPGMRVVLHEHHSDRLQELLLEEKIDFALMNIPQHLDDLVYETVIHERMLLAVNRENPLIRGLKTSVKRPAPIDLSLFKGERFILLPGDQVMGQAQENLFARMGLEGVESLYRTSTTTAVNLVSAGFGVTFLPEGGSRQVSHVDHLAFFTVGAPPFSVPLLFLYKKNVFVTPQARDFIEMTKAYYNGLRPPADL